MAKIVDEGVRRYQRRDEGGTLGRLLRSAREAAEYVTMRKDAEMTNARDGVMQVGLGGTWVQRLQRLQEVGLGGSPRSEPRGAHAHGPSACLALMKLRE